MLPPWPAIRALVPTLPQSLQELLIGVGQILGSEGFWAGTAGRIMSSQFSGLLIGSCCVLCARSPVCIRRHMNHSIEQLGDDGRFVVYHHDDRPTRRASPASLRLETFELARSSASRLPSAREPPQCSRFTSTWRVADRGPGGSSNQVTSWSDAEIWPRRSTLLEGSQRTYAPILRLFEELYLGHLKADVSPVGRDVETIRGVGRRVRKRIRVGLQAHREGLTHLGVDGGPIDAAVVRTFQ
jgi:hypothetical protein